MDRSNTYQSTVGWYEKNAEKYAAKAKEFPKIDLQQLNEFAALLPEHATILDAGCGPGRDTNQFSDRGFKPIGVDISKNLIREARKSYPNCNFEEGDILDLQFPDKYFDAIWAHASLVHFDTIEKFQKSLDELSRVLKNDGLMHILIRARRGDVKIDSVSNGERSYLNLSENEFRQALENTKLKILQMGQYNENDLDPNKRPGEGIEWLLAIAQKSL